MSSQSAQGGATEHPAEETRVAPDGARYTRNEFLEYYHSDEAWQRAGAPEHGAGASNVGPEHGASASSAGPAGVQEPVGATTQPTAAASATEHAEVLLRADQLPSIRAANATAHAGGLHAQARELLNHLAAEPAVASIDISAQWASWKRYVACHKDAVELVGPGVVAVEAVRIPDTSDPNRFGQQRLDFFIRRVDGSAYRLHPGSKPRTSAKPVYVRPQMPQSTYTLDQIQEIPQIDRIPKNVAFNKLLQNTWVEDEDVTDGTRFSWMRFVANLGALAPQIMGDGVTQVRLHEVTESMIRMHFVTNTGTTRLCLARTTSPHAGKGDVTQAWLE